MEQASLTTENLRNTMATVDAMKTANKEMRKQYGKIDIDKIEVRSCSHLAVFPLTTLFSVLLSSIWLFCLAATSVTPLPLPT